jgi:hypothetical protein
MLKTENRLEELMSTGRIMIENALADEEILKLMNQYGYDRMKVREGMALYEEAALLFNEQKIVYDRQLEAMEDMHQAWAESDTCYKKAMKAAQTALMDNSNAETLLMIRGERKNSLSGWLEQAGIFYSTLLSDLDLRKSMEEYGYTAVKLTREMALVARVMEKAYIQTRESGKAQEITERRDMKLNDLDRWISGFKSIANIALEEKPAKLETLGLITKKPNLSPGFIPLEEPPAIIISAN